MTEQEQRIALCEWAGWKCVEAPAAAWSDWSLKPKDKEYWKDCEDTDLPDTNSLDVLHVMEKKLTGIHLSAYCELLLGGRHHTGWADNWPAIHATAAQRREALLKTLGLWKD